MRTEKAGPRPPRVPEQRKPEFSVVTLFRQDLYSTGGRRSGFFRVCSVRPTVPCAKTSLLLSDAPQVLMRTQKQLTVADSNRGIRRFSQ